MPLYQMLCISVHHPDYAQIKALVTQTAKHVLDAGGVVRKIESWGTRTLPQRMRRHKNYYYIGDYWLMHFDTSPGVLRSLNGVLRQDPLVIRWTVLNKAHKVEDIAEEGRKLITHDSKTGFFLPTVESRLADIGPNVNLTTDSKSSTTSKSP